MSNALRINEQTLIQAHYDYHRGGYLSESTRNDDGTVWRRPGTTGDTDTVRVMPESPSWNEDRYYPNGYWVRTNQSNQLTFGMEEQELEQRPTSPCHRKLRFYCLWSMVMIDTSVPDPNIVAELITSEVLTQVCIGEYQVILNFTNALSILVQSKIKVTSQSANEVLCCDKPKETSILVDFLGKSIKSHSVENGEVILVFSDGSKIKLLRSAYYESFSIRNGKDAIFI